jgi:hypothetical protein
MKTCYNTLENLEELDKFLDAFWPTKLNQEVINHLNRSITSRDWNRNKDSLNKEKPRTEWFTAEFYQAFKELTPILFKLTHQIERNTAKSVITLIPKQKKNIIYGPISLTDIDIEILNKILTNQIYKYIKKIIDKKIKLVSLQRFKDNSTHASQ